MKPALSFFCLFFALIMPALAAGGSSVQRGRELIDALGCKSCHSYQRNGAVRAPALDGAGKRYSWKGLRKLVSRNPPGKDGLRMPGYRALTATDYKALDRALSQR